MFLKCCMIVAPEYGFVRPVVDGRFSLIHWIRNRAEPRVSSSLLCAST